MKNNIIGYAYYAGTYDVNLYKVIKKNEEVVFKLIGWQSFNRKEKIDEYVILLEEQGYKSKDEFINNNENKKLEKKMGG